MPVLAPVTTAGVGAGGGWGMGFPVRCQSIAARAFAPGQPAALARAGGGGAGAAALAPAISAAPPALVPPPRRLCATDCPPSAGPPCQRAGVDAARRPGPLLRPAAPLAAPDFLPGRRWPRAETGHTGNTGFRQRAGERQNACAIGDCAMKDCASRQAQPFRLL